MALVNIEGHHGLVRDTRSKAVLNNDRKALDEYLMKVELAKKQTAEKEETKMRLTKLEENISKAKELLEKLKQSKK